MREPTHKTLVSIGGFSHEGIAATTQVHNLRTEDVKLTGLQPKTWARKIDHIATLSRGDGIAGIVLYLPTGLFLQATRAEYWPTVRALLEIMKGVKSIVCVFEENLSGDFSKRDFKTGKRLSLDELESHYEAAEEEGWSEWSLNRLYQAIECQRDAESRRGQIQAAIKELLSSGVPISPFHTRSDVTIRLQEFLEDLDQGVFLRLFIPDARYQAEQLQSLLAVLERYLRQVEGQRFSVDQQKTAGGIVYVFKNDEGKVDLAEFDAAVARFDEFMKLCGDNPAAAQVVLREKGLPSEDVAYLVMKYSRDYRRLALDVRHEFENKSQLLRQRLENDLLEIGPDLSTRGLEQQGPSALLALSGDARPVSVAIGSLTVIAGDQVLNRADQIVNGGIVYNTHDKELMALFHRYADRLEALQLRSDLDQLKDASSPEPSKMTAKQRIVAFHHRAASKAGEVAEKVAVDVLSKYLAGLLPGKP